MESLDTQASPAAPAGLERDLRTLLARAAQLLCPENPLHDVPPHSCGTEADEGAAPVAENSRDELLQREWFYTVRGPSNGSGARVVGLAELARAQGARESAGSLHFGRLRRLDTELGRLGAVLYLKDVEERYVYVNTVDGHVLGRPLAEVLGRSDHELLAPEDASARRLHDARAQQLAWAEVREESLPEANEGRSSYWSARGVLWPDSPRPMLLGVSAPAQVPRRLPRPAMPTRDRFRAFFEGSGDPLLALSDARISEINSAALRLMNLPSASAALGHRLEEFSALLQADMRASSEVLEAHLRDLQAQGALRFEWLLRPLGASDMIPIEVRLSEVDVQGSPAALLGLRDLRPERAREARLEHAALHDVLTDLPNRALLLDRIELALGHSARSGEYGAVLYLDLDGFKSLNDLCGHAAGDHLLQQVSVRLSANVRSVDTMARIGGDEFVVLLTGLGHNAPQALEHALGIAEKIRHALDGRAEQRSPPAEPGIAELPLPIVEAPCWSCPNGPALSASIGLTLFGSGPSTAALLLAQADAAMYEAKHGGGNRTCSRH